MASERLPFETEIKDAVDTTAVWFAFDLGYRPAVALLGEEGVTP